MTRAFFTSDLHFGHRMVSQHRGFASRDSTGLLVSDIEVHDSTLCERWREVVFPGDIVWILGDLAVSNPTRALDILAELPGKKRLVSGNHDYIHPMHRNAWKWAEAYGKVFEFVTPFAQVGISAGKNKKNTLVALSHFPYTRDRGEARHMQWRLRNEGELPLIHGHTHGKEQLTITPSRKAKTYHDPNTGLSEVRIVPATVEIHVGVDAWDFRPVSEIDIHRLLVEAGRAE